MNMDIGKKIKFYRNQRGYTQKKLGELCGMADSAIRRYEAGRANPKIETLTKIANALDCNVFDLDETITQKQDSKILHNNFNIGEIITKRREELGISLDELSELTGYKNTTLEALENGEDYFPGKILEDVAEKIGLSVLDMLSSESGYYYICQDRDGCTRIDTISVGVDPIFVPNSFYERMLAEHLNLLQEEIGNNGEEFPTWIALLETMCDILLNHDIYSEFVGVSPYLRLLNPTGFHKLVDYIRDLIEVQRYTILDDCSEAEKEYYTKLYTELNKKTKNKKG